MHKMILFFLATLSFFLIGCDSGTSNLETGILQGKVTIGPICNVENPDFPCDPPPELYLSHHLSISTKDGHFVKDVSLDGTGNYQTDLPAGTYMVAFSPNDIGIHGFTPVETSVTAGATTTLNINIDTGIR